MGAVLFICHVIFLIYRCVLLLKKQERGNNEEGVSVIMTCSNKAELLRENLVAYLEQDYPSFEVIIVDECSEDETQHVLSDFQKQYPHLRTTRIFPDTKFRRTKKIAINIGVLAATYDILLFAEINARPESKIGFGLCSRILTGILLLYWDMPIINVQKVLLYAGISVSFVSGKT